MCLRPWMAVLDATTLKDEEEVAAAAEAAATAAPAPAVAVVGRLSGMAAAAATAAAAVAKSAFNIRMVNRRRYYGIARVNFFERERP